MNTNRISSTPDQLKMSLKKQLRAVRSYVRREGRMTDAQKQALVQLWPRYGIDFNQKPLALTALFQRQAPKIMEIGFGMGDSLCAIAQANPKQDFIGVEVYRPGAGNLLLQVAELGLTNVKVICHDASEALQAGIEDGALAAVHIFFPDPWPKRRHHKRRLIQVPFVQEIQRKLATRGRLHLLTDWQHYAVHMLKTIESVPGWQNHYGPGQMPHYQENPIHSKFGLRAEREGREIWELIFIKQH